MSAEIIFVLEQKLIGYRYAVDCLLNDHRTVT